MCSFLKRGKEKSGNNKLERRTVRKKRNEKTQLMEDQKKVTSLSAPDISVSSSCGNDKGFLSRSFPSFSLDSTPDEHGKAKNLCASSERHAHSTTTVSECREANELEGRSTRTEKMEPKDNNKEGICTEPHLQSCSSCSSAPVRSKTTTTMAATTTTRMSTSSTSTPSTSPKSTDPCGMDAIPSPGPSPPLESSSAAGSPGEIEKEAALLLSTCSLYALFHLEARLKEAATLARTICLTIDDAPPPRRDASPEGGTKIGVKDGEDEADQPLYSVPVRSSYRNRFRAVNCDPQRLIFPRSAESSITSMEVKNTEAFPGSPGSRAGKVPIQGGRLDGTPLGVPPLSPSSLPFLKKPLSPIPHRVKDDEHIPESIQALRAKHQNFSSDLQ